MRCSEADSKRKTRLNDVLRYARLVMFCGQAWVSLHEVWSNRTLCCFTRGRVREVSHQNWRGVSTIGKSGWTLFVFSPKSTRGDDRTHSSHIIPDLTIRLPPNCLYNQMQRRRIDISSYCDFQKFLATTFELSI